MSNNPYNNSYVNYHLLRIMATITAVTVVGMVAVTVMVTDPATDLAVTITILTNSVTEATAKVDNNIVATKSKTRVIAVHVLEPLAVPAVCCRYACVDRSNLSLFIMAEVQYNEGIGFLNFRL